MKKLFAIITLALCLAAPAFAAPILSLRSPDFNVDLTSEACTGKAAEVVKNGLGDDPKEYKAGVLVERGKKAVALCYKVYLDEGGVCLVSADGRHADIPLENFGKARATMK